WSTHILKKNSPQFLEDNSLSQLNNRSNTTRSHELEGTATKKNL
ncbi:6413_t:CDS:1, partial [Rhizophagus irregularis]